jgi:hypothetical protein
LPSLGFALVTTKHRTCMSVCRNYAILPLNECNETHRKQIDLWSKLLFCNHG